MGMLRSTRRALLFRPPVAAGGGNWWEIAGQTCVAAYAAKGAADLAASYVNLANPGTDDLTQVVAPTFNTTTGWTFAANGTGTGGCVTGPTMADGYTCAIRVVNMAGANSPFITATNWEMLAHGSGGWTYYTYRGTTVPRSSVSSATVVLAAGQVYVDGTADGVAITGASAVGGTFKIGTNAAAWIRGGVIAALAIYSTTLDAAQVAALTTAMQGL